MIELKNNPAGNFFLLAGPCVIEGEEMAMRIAERVVKITEALQIPVFFPQHRRPLTAANAVPRGQTDDSIVFLSAPEFLPAMLFLLSKTHESPQGMRFLFL